jgi:outer membrane protein assembly factor BamA
VLTRNIIVPDRGVPAAQRVAAAEVAPYIRLSPAPRLRFGAPPTVLDSALIVRSARNMEAYLRGRGYYDSHLDWRVDTRGRRARATYKITQGRPYIIDSVRYVFYDSVPIDTLGRLVNAGDVFDVERLDAERRRITADMRRRGYYKFTVNNVEFVADTARADRRVSLTLAVRPNVARYNERGEAVYAPNHRYAISKVVVDPDRNSPAAPDDTINVDGLDIVQRGRFRLRARTLRRTIVLRPGQLYDLAKVDETYSGIMRLGYFRSASIRFDELGGDTLRGRIECAPALRQSIRTDLEGSVSSNFSAVGATLGYSNRNLLRGAELFDASLTGRYEFLRSVGRTGSYEIGGGVSVTLPRLLSPITWHAHDPRTKLEASLNYQDRLIYRRTLSGLRLSYTWSNSRRSAFIYRPVDLNLIDVRDIDQAFLVNLRNPYLRNSYLSQLVPGTSLGWVRSGRTTVRVGAETAGNLFSLFPRAVDGRFSRYARVEASVANTIPTGLKTQFVWRVLAGGAASYGRLDTNPIPIDRLFYSGGSNSMRGWIVRRLGPGTLRNDRKDYPSQVGNMKLEANVEFRFPVWDFVHSAVFVDVGNIWFAGRRDYEETQMNNAAMFRFNNFYRQLGLNTGLGLRLDFRRFLFRIDWGVKLHDPGMPSHQRWIQRFHLRNTALNFGVGYPF